MIEHAQGHGWVFIFSGADIDAFGVGHSMGISGAYTSGYDKSDPMGTTMSYAATSNVLRNLRTDQTIPQDGISPNVTETK